MSLRVGVIGLGIMGGAFAANLVKNGFQVTGFDPVTDGFFWNIGQGGAGIQTSAGLSAYAAAVILETEIPEALAATGMTKETLSPARL